MSTTETTTPAVWIGCLAAYNNGKLHGRWVPVPTDPDELHAEIQAVLKSSPEPGAEEWAFMDNEGFAPLRIGEYESVERLCKIVEGVEEYGEAFLAFLDTGIVGEDVDSVDEAIRHGFSDSFRGEYGSVKEFAEAQAHELGLGGIPAGPSLTMERSYDRGPEKVNVIEMLESYIDWDAVAREAEMENTVVEARGGGVYVFSN